MGQLEWARSQATNMTQIRGSKSSSVKQQEDKEEMGGLYFKSGKDACISSKLWEIRQWVLQISLEKIPTESIKWKANLKWPGLKLLLKNFHFWEFFNLGRPPTRIRPSEKSLCFSITLKCAFEPLIIIFRALSSPYLLSSAPSSPWPAKVLRFLALPPFSRTPSSLTSLQMHPRAFDHHF